MPKIEIDVDQILTCAVPIEADPGDRLMVMNGLVIGIIDRAAVRPEPKPKTQAEPAPPAMPDGISALAGVALRVLKEDGPLNAFQVAKRITGCPSVRLAMFELRRRKLIEPTSEDRFPDYRAVKR